MWSTSKIGTTEVGHSGQAGKVEGASVRSTKEGGKEGGGSQGDLFTPKCNCRGDVWRRRKSRCRERFERDSVYEKPRDRDRDAFADRVEEKVSGGGRQEGTFKRLQKNFDKMK